MPLFWVGKASGILHRRPLVDLIPSLFIAEVGSGFSARAVNLAATSVCPTHPLFQEIVVEIK